MTKPEQNYDLVIIGGGINGAGIACDAAGRGLKVLLCEQGDLANATSSASSKMIHGGLRYLEFYEFGLVRKALAEREVLLTKAPHIVRPLRLYLPHRNAVRPAWMVRAGLFLYDHLTRLKRLPGSRSIAFRRHFTGKALHSDISRGFAYSDCWVDDSRLVIFNAMAARDLGADIASRTKVVAARRDNGRWVIDVAEQPHGSKRTVRAKALVNAAGPWVQSVLDNNIQVASSKRIRLVKGSHIVVPRLYEGTHAYLLQLTDRRVVFVLPFEHDFTMIGTTDIDFTGDPAQVHADDGEIAYLCTAANEFLAARISPDDVVWAFAGVRPLFDNEREDPSAITRDYALDLDGGPGEAPLLNVFGGKLTTYRRLAEQALADLAPAFPEIGPSWTASQALPGGNIDDADFTAFVSRLATARPGFDTGLLERLARRHGTLVTAVLGDAETADDLGRHFGGDLYAREVDYLIEREWAMCGDDVLWRRTKAGLHLDTVARAAVDAYVDAQLGRLPTADTG